MNLYASQQEVERLEGDVALLEDEARLQPLVELAWHLRQRDTRRSLALAQEAEAFGASHHAGRIALVRGEAALLALDVDGAREALATALAAFEAQGDAIGRGDAHLFEGRVANLLGDVSAEKAAAAKAHASYEAAEEPLRTAHARAAGLLADGPRDPDATRDAIAVLRRTHTDPALDGQVSYAAAILEFIEGRFADALETLAPVAQGAALAGAGDIAMRATLTMASALQNLGDREASAQATERALEAARANHWPRWVGPALSSLGRLLTYMQQPARAIEVLEESAQVLAALPGSRHHAMTLFYLGDAYLASGEPERALAPLAQSEAAARTLGIAPEVSATLAATARALSRLGRQDEALPKANEALEAARSVRARLWEAEALRALAEIRAHDSAPVALRHLEDAVAATEALGGHHEKSQLLVEMAAVHERSGDLGAALAAERAARQAQMAEQERRAANQVLVSRLRHEMATLADREEQMRRLASTDPLTGLANRRHFFAVAEAEVERARRYGGPVGLVTGDVDKFKSINDIYGHPAGDHVLVAVARVLRSRPRMNDVLARLGGEEFALLLPGADRDATLAVAERIRAEVEAMHLEWQGEPIRVTISLGCVSSAPSSEPQERGAAAIFEGLVHASDRKLYEAKLGGRNRCVG